MFTKSQSCSLVHPSVVLLFFVQFFRILSLVHFIATTVKTHLVRLDRVNLEVIALLQHCVTHIEKIQAIESATLTSPEGKAGLKAKKAAAVHSLSKAAAVAKKNLCGGFFKNYGIGQHDALCLHEHLVSVDGHLHEGTGSDHFFNEDGRAGLAVLVLKKLLKWIAGILPKTTYKFTLVQ